MKKVKKLLVTAIAALSLSSCSLEDIKNLPAQAGSTISSTFNDLLEKVGLKKKEEQKQEVPGKEDEPGEGEGEKPEPKPEPCNHVDADHDHKCDNCGEVISQHADEDHDHKCDECGAVVSECKDENHDHNCDICGEKLSEHSDENNDFVCDVCGKQLETVSVELDYSAAKTVFVLGEEFSSEGVKVIATSEVGSKKELAFDVEAPDMTTTGEKEVVVKFGEGEEDVKSYSINVVYWDPADLEIFDYYSFTGFIPLPYVDGFNMRAVEADEESIFNFSIIADDFAEEYLDYYNLMKLYQGTVQYQSSPTSKPVELYLSMTEVQTYDGDELLEMFPEYEVASLFALVVTREYTFSDGSKALVRAFDADEYLLMGLDENGKMTISSRLVDSWYDGYFLYDDFLDGQSYWPIEYETQGQVINFNDEFCNGTIELVNEYYSELSKDKIIIPELTEDCIVVWPGSLKTMYPLDGELDAYDLAIEYEYYYGGEAEFDAFVEDLLAAGFVAEGEEGDKSYIIDDDLYGYIEYVPYVLNLANGNTAFGFDLYYIAPSEYTTYLTADIRALMSGLDVDKYETDLSYYESGEIDISFFVAAPEAIEADEEHQIEAQSSEERALLDLIEDLKALGYEVTSEAEASDYYGGDPCWVASLTDFATLNIDAFVFEPEDGKCEVIFEITKYYNFSIEDVISAVFGETQPTLEEGLYKASFEYGNTDPIDDLMESLAEISDIDGGSYGYFQSGADSLSFSGLTKDEKIIYTVEVTYGDEGFEVALQVEELSEFEDFVRFIDAVLAHYCYYSKGASIRNCTYWAIESGYVISVETYIYGGSSLQSNANNMLSILNHYFAFAPISEAEVAEDGSITYELSNGYYEAELVFSTYELQDGNDTYELLAFSMEIVPAEEAND